MVVLINLPFYVPWVFTMIYLLTGFLWLGGGFNHTRRRHSGNVIVWDIGSGIRLVVRRMSICLSSIQTSKLSFFISLVF